MLRVESLSTRPVVSIPYEYLESGIRVRHADLPVLTGTASGLPHGLDAIALTSDLQGVEPGRVTHGSPRPLGAVVAMWLDAMGAGGVIPGLALMGAILAGDLHVDTSLATRGGSSDVSPIWELFASSMKWVAGVPGNHDGFRTTESGAIKWNYAGKCHLLDGAAMEVDSFRIAGLGGVIGRGDRPYRRPERGYLRALKQICSAGPDLLVLHQSPDGGEGGYDGSVPIRDCLESLTPRFVVSGHTLWPEPLAILKNGTQVLNVAGRAVILKRSG